MTMPIQLQTGVAVGLAQTTDSEVVLQAEHLRKSFGGQVALLQGDNGSALSTMLSCLLGTLYRTLLGSKPLFGSSLPIWMPLAFVVNPYNSSTVQPLWLLG
jgi:ABC-type hemin transport system ATPase subunit